MTKTFEWTDEAMDRLRKLRIRENLTFDQVARIMGLTRNQVIGKAKRMGLLEETPPHLRAKKARENCLKGRLSQRVSQVMREADAIKSIGARPSNVNQMRVLQTIARKQMREAANDVVEQSVTEGVAKIRDVIDLEPHHCRWPLKIEGSEQWGFCGDTAGWGISYCLVHYAKSCHIPLKCVGVKAPAFPKIREAAE